MLLDHFKDKIMSCPTCQHTMKNINDTHSPIYWCSRCGTLKYGLVDNIETPKWYIYAVSMNQDSFRKFIDVDILKRSNT